MMKPTIPRLINDLRPRLSDIRAHFGAVMTQSSADQLNASDTQTSGISSWLAIAGSADCIAVLPAAATNITKNNTTTLVFGMAGTALTAFSSRSFE